MFSARPLPRLTRRLAALLGALLTTSLLALTAAAQSDVIDTEPGRGGLNAIQGNIYLPSGRRLDKRVRVRLSSVNGGDSYTLSDEHGAFSFRRLRGGSYRVTVEAGKEYETAGETVDLFDVSRGPGQTVTVQIQLQLKGVSEGKPETVNAALAAIPKQARELYEKALVAARAGESRKAVEHLEAAIKLHPDFPLAYNDLGVQRLKLGDTARALEAFRAALKLAPDAFVLHLNHGIALVRNREFRPAEAALRRASELNPSSTTARLYRGRALIRLGRFDEAEKELLQVVAANAGYEVGQAYRYLGALYIERGDKARAVNALERFLALDPKDGDTGEVRKILEQLKSNGSRKP